MLESSGRSDMLAGGEVEVSGGGGGGGVENGGAKYRRKRKVYLENVVVFVNVLFSDV